MTDEYTHRQLHDDMKEIKAEVRAMRTDVRDAMIDIATLKVKVGMISAFTAVIVSLAVQGVAKVFF